MNRPIRIGIPDLVSNSYFPIIAAAELGFLAEEGVPGSVELIFPVTKAAEALRTNEIDYLVGAAHAPLYAFPRWQGVRLLAAVSQRMYWFLVAHADLGIARGELHRLAGLRIGAAPGVADGLAALLEAVGLPPAEAGIEIAPVPGTGGAGVSFGVTAAQALGERSIDAFWANGMGTEVAVRRGIGTVVLDARRDPNPGQHFTFAVLAATERSLAEEPDRAAAVRRALLGAQRALAADPHCATGIAEGIFGAEETALIGELIRRDAPFYDPGLSPASITALQDFALGRGLLSAPVDYHQIVHPIGAEHDD